MVASASRGNGVVRWRAATLAFVYVLFAVHVIHWKLAGTTLAPLELNEVMYTFELGIVTAGALFMAVVALGTVIFGRFFCSWGCHVLALQDLSSWLLRRFGIRHPKQVRSRILLWVPVISALYLFVWPQVKRLAAGRPLPTLHLRTDAEGWASFVTEDLWRNLPGPWITAITFTVCGFVVVYLLGSRSFCTYCCPYGAVFSLTDRFAPGRIRVSADCNQCAICTAACSCGIRVHEEVERFGAVVNPACLKDLDCVEACPERALSFGFGRPALFASYRAGGRFGLPYDFSPTEDAVMASVVVGSLLIFRGLYGLVPFLLTLAIGGILAYVTVVTLRLWSRSHVRFASWQLKIRGGLTAAGKTFLPSTLLVAALVGHSAFVRYHEWRGLSPPSGESQEEVFQHLETAGRWGLVVNERVQTRLLSVGRQLERYDEVDRVARQVLERRPADVAAHLALASSLGARGRWADAERHFADASRSDEATSPERAEALQGLGSSLAVRGDFRGATEPLKEALALDPNRAAARAELGGMYAELGQVEAALAELREAVRIDPGLGQAQFNLGSLLLHLGRPDEAIPSFEKASESEPDDPTTLSNLGFALLAVGRVAEARDVLLESVALDPDHADAHFNLARAFARLDQTEAASAQLQEAARLDARYRQFRGRLE